MTGRPDDKQEEDAAELKFPKEFDSAGCDALMISEVFLLLDHRMNQSQAKDELEDVSESFTATLNYARRFSKFANRETVKVVRNLFTAGSELHKFEVAQLANLCPDTSEEAKALIPSLESKMQDEELDDILKALSDKKTF